ncbi:MAG: GMC family oxidoreductase N-terminal domain-containing protein, partial [Myxococcales bacterium]|nr:GMC family oxidoreductase N-terminal domain-containing protein [Myxococcales bacterium]
MNPIRRRPASPHQGVRSLHELPESLRARAEVVVVSSGPGGAVVAKELAERGRDVILLEEGREHPRESFEPDAAEAMLSMLREGGMRAMRGHSFTPTMQAICLGGGSVVNSAISARSPDFVFERWAERYGIEAIDPPRMARHYDAIEGFLGIAPTPMHVMGERNLAFKRGCDALGWSSAPAPRNVIGCRGSAECFTGCRNGAKQSMDVSYLPAAIRHGARVFTSARVEQVIGEGRRARGVRGRMIHPETRRPSGEFEVQADVVVLAAGCMATPVILQRSELGDPCGQAGQHLGAHPGIAILAVFPHRIRPSIGATQGYHSLHFLEQGTKLEVLWAPPAVVATRLEGFGRRFVDQLASLDRAAPFDAFVAGYDSVGSVRAPRLGANPEIRYELASSDVRKVRDALGLLCELSLAAGAERVMLGLHGQPESIRTMDQV